MALSSPPTSFRLCVCGSSKFSRIYSAFIVLPSGSVESLPQRFPFRESGALPSEYVEERAKFGVVLNWGTRNRQLGYVLQPNQSVVKLQKAFDCVCHKVSLGSFTHPHSERIVYTVRTGGRQSHWLELDPDCWKIRGNRLESASLWRSFFSVFRIRRTDGSGPVSLLNVPTI